MLSGSSGGACSKVHVHIVSKDWNIKFPHPSDPKDIGKKEYDLYVLAQNVGIQIPEVHLFTSKVSSGYFGSVRFDRHQNQGVHMVSLSSLLETTHRIPNLDYVHAFEIITLICVDQEDQYEPLKRMYFHILIQNKDDHGKNMSFMYDEGKKGYVLSPAYDITSTPSKFEHEMTVLGHGNPTRDDVMKLAKKFHLKTSRIESMMKTIESVVKTKR